MCAFVLFPAAGSEGPRWLKITSPNFELFTTAAERNAREVARQFEQVRAFFMEAMGLGLKPDTPVRIVVFRSDKEFAPYAPNDIAAAFYLGTGDRDYIVMKGAEVRLELAFMESTRPLPSRDRPLPSRDR